MAEIENPTCPRCGHHLKYKAVRWYELISLDPATWEYEVGEVEVEAEPGIWCDSCDVEIDEDDFPKGEQSQDDAD